MVNWLVGLYDLNNVKYNERYLKVVGKVIYYV